MGVRPSHLNLGFFQVQRILANMNNLALAIFICVLAISLAEVTVNLCNGGTGCCGTGMHTPSPTDGTYTGSDHTYEIYDPRADSLEDWDNWNLICRTSNIGGSVGKLVTLESRTELDCLIEYINDEFDDPSTMSKYTVGLKGKTTQNVGIYKWQGVDTSTDFDAATPSWTNWASQATTGGKPCVYMEIGQTTAPSGLWSLTDCSGEEMLGICEFE